MMTPSGTVLSQEVFYVQETEAMIRSLCESCRNMREIHTARSCFLLCELSVSNDAYPKYPPQPVVRCNGYEPTDVLIRAETTADHEAIRHVNRLAFGQDAEAHLVDALRDGGYVRASLVAEQDGQIVGHILFSALPITAEAKTVSALALAPMAVLPVYQHRGIGSALVLRGLEMCRDHGQRIVIVLGYPAYYPRFGFSAKLAEPLSSPFGGGETWMAAELVPGALAGVVGQVQYPPPFNEL
jgi:putative acetyltransferase